MTKEELSNLVRNAWSSVIARVDPASVSDHAPFSEAGLDSLDEIQLIVALEDLHGLVVEEDDIENMKCINDLVGYFLSKNIS